MPGTRPARGDGRGGLEGRGPARTPFGLTISGQVSVRRLGVSGEQGAEGFMLRDFVPPFYTSRFLIKPAPKRTTSPVAARSSEEGSGAELDEV